MERLIHYFRMAATSAALPESMFFRKGLPVPKLARYQGYSVRKAQSLGGMARQGHAFTVMLWERLDGNQAAVIVQMIEAAESTGGGVGRGVIYQTLPKTSGGASGVWIDVHGYAIMPEFVPDPDSDGKSFSNVELRLNNVTIDNEPSTVMT